MLNPTLTFQTGDIAKLPVCVKKHDNIENIVDSSISIAKGNWDSFETSWDFKKHPLV